MPVLESRIQKKVVDYARKKGAVAIKVTTLGARGSAGWPDYLFLYEGKALFIEFKREGGKLTPLQTERFRQIFMAEFAGIVADSVKAGIKALDNHFRW